VQKRNAPAGKPKPVHSIVLLTPPGDNATRAIIFDVSRSQTDDEGELRRLKPGHENR